MMYHINLSHFSKIIATTTRPIINNVFPPNSEEVKSLNAPVNIFNVF